MKILCDTDTSNLSSTEMAEYEKFLDDLIENNKAVVIGSSVYVVLSRTPNYANVVEVTKSYIEGVLAACKVNNLTFDNVIDVFDSIADKLYFPELYTVLKPSDQTFSIADMWKEV